MNTDTYHDHIHAEAHLMQWLWTKYGSFEKIPDHSTIIFVGTLSPCAQCTTTTIPDFLKHLKILERPIRVKFKFANYYSKENKNILIKHTDGGKHLFETNSAAQSAYSGLCAKYGEYHRTPVTNLDGQELIGVKIKPKLAIIHGYQNKASTVISLAQAAMND